MENYVKNDSVEIWAVFRNREYFDSGRVFWNKTFLAFKEEDFWESITSKIFEPSSWSFLSKCGNFHVDFKNGKKKNRIFRLVFKIIAFELDGEISLNYEENTSDQSSTC